MGKTVEERRVEGAAAAVVEIGGGGGGSADVGFHGLGDKLGPAAGTGGAQAGWQVSAKQVLGEDEAESDGPRHAGPAREMAETLAIEAGKCAEQLREVANPQQAGPAMAGTMDAEDEQVLFGGQAGHGGSVEDSVHATGPEEVEAEGGEEMRRGKAPAEFDDGVTGSVLEAQFVLFAVIEGVAGGLQESCGREGIAAAEQQVEVTRLAERQGAVDGLGEEGALEGQGGNLVVVQQVENGGEFGGERAVEGEVEYGMCVKAGQYRVRDEVRAERGEALVQQRDDTVTLRQAQEFVEGDRFLQQAADGGDAPGVEAGVTATAEELKLRRHGRAQEDFRTFEAPEPEKQRKRSLYTIGCPIYTLADGKSMAFGGPMPENKLPVPEESPETKITGDNTDISKPGFAPPKMTFVKPELVQQGGFAEVTGQFFGTFFP